MSIPFVDRVPTIEEVEMLRLILSTYQDGSGMITGRDHTLPGWRDFERAVAATFEGQARESKWIYDVVLEDPTNKIQYGLSCKMRKTLRYVEKKGRVTIELSNASGEFWDRVKTRGITQEDYHRHPNIVGETLVEIVEGWHKRVGISKGGLVDSDKSCFLSLQWEERSGRYQLFQYPIDLPDPRTLKWEVVSRRLIGRDVTGILFEWYGLSGGQLKYYPLAKSAIWQSYIFRLEPLPNTLEYGIRHKAQSYFPELWAKIFS